MKIVGLTGSIGMGKSTAAAMLRRRGVPVHDSDAAVHRLQAPGGAAVAPIVARFGPAVQRPDGGIDRPALAAIVFADKAALRDLEAILHPRVQAEAAAFLKRCARARRRLVVLDIPLLMERGGRRRFDAVLVVSASRLLQDQRVLARPGMTRDRLDRIRAQQLPDRVKRARATAVVRSGLGRAVAWRDLGRALALIAGSSRPFGNVRRRAWPPGCAPPVQQQEWRAGRRRRSARRQAD